jgi:hypothetical protein
VHLYLEFDEFTALTIRRTGGASLTTDVLQAINAIEGVCFAPHMRSGNTVMVIWPTLKPEQDEDAIRVIVHTIRTALVKMGHQVRTTKHIPDVDKWLA